MHPTIPVGTGPNGIVAADFNQDGKLDVVSATSSDFVAVTVDLVADPGTTLPLLNIVRKDGTIELDWPATFPNYQLMESKALQQWKFSDRTVDIVDNVFKVIIDNIGGENFFRLAQTP